MRYSFLAVGTALLASAPAAGVPSVDPNEIAAHQEIATAMDQAMAEFLKPGPKVEGWDKGGVDLAGLVAAAPGGTRENYLVETDDKGEATITILGADNFEAKLPADWKAKLHAGSSKEPQPGDDLTISVLDGPYFVAGWEKRRRVGDAYCAYGAIGGYLYESTNSKARPEMPPEFIPTMFHSAATGFEKVKMCWRFDREGDGFRTRHFLEDGRSLPNLDAMSGITRIVKARPIEELLAEPAR